MKGREDMAMKTRTGIANVVFLTGICLGFMTPSLVFASETATGNAWDQFVYTKSFKATATLNGVLSIYYKYTECDTTNCPGDCSADMFYVVNLINPNLTTTVYQFQGSSQTSYPNGICVKDILGQGTEILNFFGNIVSGTIAASSPLPFPNGVKAWHLTAIDNGVVNDQSTPPPLGSRSFVADVVISVQEKK